MSVLIQKTPDSKRYIAGSLIFQLTFYIFKDTKTYPVTLEVFTLVSSLDQSLEYMYSPFPLQFLYQLVG